MASTLIYGEHNVHHNVGKASTQKAAKPQKPKLYNTKNVNFCIFFKIRSSLLHEN